MPIDGDFANIVLPAQHYQDVLEDPFGFQAITQSTKHAGANRFFIHRFMHFYFKKVPLFLQKYLNPVHSLYASIALLKLAIQLTMLFLLSQIIAKTNNFRAKDLYLSIILLIPFFQSFGYNEQMGIIFKPITYTCFYALPLLGLIWFLLPYFLALRNGHYVYISPLRSFFMGMLVVALPLSGPLISPLILILIPMIIVGFIMSSSTLRWPPQLNLSKSLWLVVIMLLASYAMYLGNYNIENIGNQSISLLEKYKRIPMGFAEMLSAKPGLGILLGFMLINIVLVFRVKKSSKELKRLLYFVLAFSIIYIFLLPFGGYRSYRPNIVKADVLLPVVIALFIFITSSTIYLIKNQTVLYKVITVAIFAIFTWADKPNFYFNNCEKKNLIGLRELNENESLINDNCTIMAWDKITIPQYSITNAKLLNELNVTEDVKLYYQK